MSYRKKRKISKTKKADTSDSLDREIHNPATLQDISSARITSGLPYQRPIRPARIRYLQQHWDPRLLKPLDVSFRDGTFNLMNGQHRLTVLREQNDGGDVIVSCRVYTGLTYEDEAELCVLLDQADKRMSMVQSVSAKLESGKDPKLNDIKKLIDYEGFIWPVEKSHNGQYEITANRALIGAYDLLGAGSFYQMLRLLKKTWEGDPESLNALMLSGVALFLKTYETEVVEPTFIQHLSASSPTEITRRAKADFSTNSNALRCARVILEKYNKGSRGGKKLAYRFRA